jgi:RNA polymerase sigma-70 factor (ECF subfamily)
MTFPLWLLVPFSGDGGGVGDAQRVPNPPRVIEVQAEPVSEPDVIARLREGEEHALRTIMERYFDTVTDVALHYVRHVDVARDIAQEVFIRVWHRRRTLDPTAPIVHYLRRAARNASLDALDRDKAAGKLATTLAAAVNGDAYGENLGAQSLEMGDIHAAVHRALATLSPRVREVATLYIEGGFEPGEIAELLNVAPRTIYNQLRTAMQTLKPALAEWAR